MNKYLITGIIIIAVLVAGFFFYNNQQQETDLSQLFDAIVVLEDELDDIDYYARSGALSPTEAYEARVRIMEQLQIIQNSAQPGRSGLTEAQREQLQEGLGRLASILQTYLLTLSAIDTTAATIAADDIPTTAPREFRDKTVLDAVAETLTSVAEVADLSRPIEPAELELLEQGSEVDEEDEDHNNDDETSSDADQDDEAEEERL